MDPVLRHTAIPDAIVQWKKPDNPIFCSLKSWESLAFTLEKPICVNTYMKHVKLMATSVGLGENITSYSFR